MTDITNTDCTCHRKKARDEKERRDLMNRLKRIEGQIRGLQRMLDEDAYCPDTRSGLRGQFSAQQLLQDSAGKPHPDVRY